MRASAFKPSVEKNPNKLTTYLTKRTKNNYNLGKCKTSNTIKLSKQKQNNEITNTQSHLSKPLQSLTLAKILCSAGLVVSTKVMFSAS